MDSQLVLLAGETNHSADRQIQRGVKRRTSLADVFRDRAFTLIHCALVVQCFDFNVDRDVMSRLRSLILRR